MTSPITANYLLLTNLKNRLRLPAAVRSRYKKASFRSSNLRNHSSQEIGFNAPSPENPGKSIRSTPGLPLLAVRMTAAGCPPRSSVHRTIFSRSVVTFALDRRGLAFVPFPALARRVDCRPMESFMIRPIQRGLTELARSAGLIPRPLVVVDLDRFCINR